MEKIKKGGQMKQTEQDHERMMKFFEKLLKVKSYVKSNMDKNKDPVLKEIYMKLDEIIKEDKSK